MYAKYGENEKIKKKIEVKVEMVEYRSVKKDVLDIYFMSGIILSARGQKSCE